MITVHHESWVATLEISIPETWKKSTFYQLVKNHFWVVCQNDYNFTEGGYGEMITVLHRERDPQKWLRNMCTTPKAIFLLIYMRSGEAEMTFLWILKYLLQASCPFEVIIFSAAATPPLASYHQIIALPPPPSSSSPLPPSSCHQILQWSMSFLSSSFLDISSV